MWCSSSLSVTLVHTPTQSYAWTDSTIVALRKSETYWLSTTSDHPLGFLALMTRKLYNSLAAPTKFVLWWLHWSRPCSHKFRTASTASLWLHCPPMTMGQEGSYQHFLSIHFHPFMPALIPSSLTTPQEASVSGILHHVSKWNTPSRNLHVELYVVPTPLPE